MRIAHCILAFNTGGAETMLIDIINQQVKTEDVFLIIVNDSYQQSLIDCIDKKAKIIFLHRKPGSRSPFSLIRLNMTLLKLRPDIIHIHNSTLCKMVLPFVSRGLFYTVHALQLPLEAVRRGLNLIAISNAVENDVLTRGKYNIRTIPNGINIDAIAKRDNRSINKENPMRIVQVARLDASKKGQDILIEAIAVLKQRGLSNIDVDFIGEGDSLKMLQEKSRQLNVDGQIHFLGLRNRTYIYSHLKDYDLMCHPARYEGFGLTVAEGIAAMLPVLVSDDGGPYEIICKGKYGMSFKMEDVTDCADKLEYIYNHYQETMNKTKPAYNYICQNYSIENMVNNYLKYYKAPFNHNGEA